MVYFKLGELAQVFSDPYSQVTITLDEVVALEKAPKNNKFKKALSGGHIQKASATEYDDYIKAQKALKAKTPVATDSDEIKAKLADLEKREKALIANEKSLETKEEALKEKEEALKDEVVVPEGFPEEGAKKDVLMAWATEYFEEADVKLAKELKNIVKLRAFLLKTSQGYTFE